MSLTGICWKIQIASESTGLGKGTPSSVYIKSMYAAGYRPGRGSNGSMQMTETEASYSFVRKSKDGKKNLLFVINFTPVAREDYRVGVPKRKQYRLILNSDEEKYGGTGKKRPAVYKAEKSECDGRP